MTDEHPAHEDAANGISRRDLLGLAVAIPGVLASCAVVGADRTEAPEGHDNIPDGVGSFEAVYDGTSLRCLFDTAGDPTGDNLLAVVLLHGAGQSGTQWTRVGLVDVLDRIDLRGQAIVAVAPDLGRPAFAETFITESVMPEIVDRFSPNHFAVSGISRGGAMALDLALRNRDIFRSVGLHSPASDLTHTIEPTSTRFWLDIGDDDYLLDGALRTADSLRASRVDLTEHVWQGEHVEDYWEAHLPEYFAFHLNDAGA